jgi:hypothetical protein
MAWIADKDIIRFEAANPAGFERSRHALRRIDAEAFGVIMNVLRFYREADTDEDRILQNAAKRILYIQGSWTPENETGLSAALQNAPLIPKKRGKL